MRRPHSHDQTLVTPVLADLFHTSFCTAQSLPLPSLSRTSGARMGGDGDLVPLPVSASGAAREAQYAEVCTRITALLDGESDWVAAQATVACELHSAFECAYGRSVRSLPACGAHVALAVRPVPWALPTVRRLSLGGLLPRRGRARAGDRPLPGRPRLPAHRLQPRRVRRRGAQP